MSKFTTNQTSFKAGVLSPKLHGRSDIREYAEALTIGENALIGKEGGAYKRFGLRPLLSTGTGLQFMQSVIMFANKTLFFVFYTNSFRVFDGQGRDVGGGFKSLGASRNIQQYDMAVIENTVVMTHYSGTMKPMYIDFVLQDNGIVKLDKQYTISDGYLYGRPLAKIDPAIRFHTSGNGPALLTLTIDASSDYFDSDMEGEYIMLELLTPTQGSSRLANNMYKIDLVISPTQAQVTPNNFLSNSYGTFDFLAPSIWDTGNDRYQPTGADSVETDLAWQSAWSDRQGWPKTVTVDEGRLVFGGTNKFPATMWGSKTNEYKFFLDKRSVDGRFSWRIGNLYAENNKYEREYAGDIVSTDPYNFTIASKEGAVITFMESAVNFVIGTNRKEFLVSGDGAAISQKNINVRPHTSHGSAPLKAMTYDNVTLFTSRSTDILHMFLYNQANGSYITKEVSILNEDILIGGIKQLSWHEELNICFIVTNSNELVALTLNNETQTTAFSSQIIAGSVQSVAYAVDGDEEYIAVMRIGENGVNYIEKIDRFPNVLLPFELFNIIDRLSYLDKSRFFRATEAKNIFWADREDDYFNYDYSQLKIGDTVEFTTSDPAIFVGTGLAPNVTYYVIPYVSSAEAGFRVALTLGDAQTNNYLDILGAGVWTIYDETLTANFGRDNQVIPTAHFVSGEEVTYFGVSGGNVTEGTFIADGNDTYDLGTAYTDVVYGLVVPFHVATAPIEAGQQWGTSQLGIKRVDKASVRVYKTRSYKIGTDGYNMEDRVFDDIYTGRDEVAVTGNPEYDHVIHIQNDKAEPCYVSNLVMRGVNNDG